MEIGVAEASWQVFTALFATGCVYAILNHYFIVVVSIWKNYFK